MNYQGTELHSGSLITANVSSCIDFYGIDKLINTEVAIIAWQGHNSL
jgi:hypothetical protein